MQRNLNNLSQRCKTIAALDEGSMREISQSALNESAREFFCKWDDEKVCKYRLTVIIVSRKIHFVNEEIVITVQLPEFAVDHVEVFITEVSGHLIDVLFVLQNVDYRE